jgi:hypothetical protein
MDVWNLTLLLGVTAILVGMLSAVAYMASASEASGP